MRYLTLLALATSAAHVELFCDIDLNNASLRHALNTMITSCSDAVALDLALLASRRTVLRRTYAYVSA